MTTSALSRRVFFSAIAGTWLSSRQSAVAAETAIAGGGSSFSRPVVQRWIDAMPKASGAKVDFTVMGTGDAQTRILSGAIDFAAVELPLSEELLANGNLFQFPVAFGALAFIVNIPGIAANRLRLDGVLLAGIYGGSIKKWNDPKIVAANPGLALPDLEVRPLRLDKPDGSVFSTTTTFTQYLLATNPEWRAKFGDSVGKRRWAVGSMAGAADALAESVKVLPGSIGYMALGSALSGKLATVLLTNKTGEAVAADLASLNAAVGAVDWGASQNIVARAINLPGHGVWPLVLPIYVLIAQTPKDNARGALVRAFVNFAIGAGAGVTSQSNAAPVPPTLRKRIAALIGTDAG